MKEGRYKNGWNADRKGIGKGEMKRGAVKNKGGENVVRNEGDKGSYERIRKKILRSNGSKGVTRETVG